MLFLIGVFILLISIIIDDGSTMILYYLGYGSLETNPILSRYPHALSILLIILGYLFMIFVWRYSIHSYKKAHKRRESAYKFTDISVFICCVFLVFTAVGKITLGMNNINMIENLMSSQEYQIQIQEKSTGMSYLKITQPDKYIEITDNNYYDGKPFKWSIAEVYIYSLFAFILFKVGSRISPNGIGG